MITKEELLKQRQSFVKTIKNDEPKNPDKNSREYEIMLAMENQVLVILDLFAIISPEKEVIENYRYALARTLLQIVENYDFNACIIHTSKLVLSVLDSFEALENLL